MQKLAIDSIVIDERIQVRELDPELAVDYAAKMKDGAVFPPIVVFLIDGAYCLSSGRHRFEAHKMNGALEVDSIVKEGTFDDAYLFGVQENGTHGQRYSHSETVEIVRKLCKHPVWGGWTNTTLGKIVGVTGMTIGRIRKKIEQESEEPETVKKYSTKDGAEKTVNTKQLATKKQKEPEPENEEAIGELTDVVTQLEEENKKLRDAVALGQFDATEIEKIDIEDTLAQLREENRVLRIENEALKKSRDQYQKENSELIRTVKSLQNKLKKAA
jgi:hypothetical protein